MVVLAERTILRSLPGRATGSVRIEVLSLGLEEDGRLLGPADVDRLGLAVAPVEQLQIRATLIQRTVGNDTSVWLGWGTGSTTDETVDAMLRERPDFRPLAKLGTKPRDLAMDKDVFYKGLFGKEPTSCSAYVHPAPESGDFYDVERCFAPGVGMLSTLKLTSVWGSYELELMNVAH